ncbi:hypothetical protein G5714_005190 [Onychostoma macrolepis]|uniref:Uncharacterized protein n=1 Tax=Onychostoma macrolepis TaxID=369639 RepID=A0A7J6D6S8_9TELE|nr:hypothetical protein G5714_005190 [Onychostoma macrolepis]
MEAALPWHAGSFQRNLRGARPVPELRPSEWRLVFVPENFTRETSHASKSRSPVGLALLFCSSVCFVFVAGCSRTLVGTPPWLFSARAPSRSPLPILLCSRSAPPLDFSGRCL